MHTLRTRFAKDIVTEFLPPNKKSQKVVIICSGMPSVPAKKDVMEFFAKKGFWVFYPRYRGTWESGGTFLQKSPHQDVLDVISGITKGFTDFYSKKKFKITPKKLFLMGSSFGGPAVILASNDSRVTKVVALSPVIDWRAQGKTEPLSWLKWFTKEAFGNGYRFNKNSFRKLYSGSFYNPMSQVDKLDGNKLLIIHAKDDKVVPLKPAIRFSKKTGSKMIIIQKGGHLSLSALVKPSMYNKVKKMLK
ncbi:alpha/beta hydrolase family protein [Patescibacteria group bacterium]